MSEPTIVSLAIGRLLRIMSRPYQPGDEEQFEMCRRIIMDHALDRAPDHEVNWARDRLKGAQGD